MIYLLDLYDVAEAIGHAFRWLIGYLSTLIYNLIVVMYDLFEYLARAEILSNSFVQEIYKKVGFLLGLFMLFKLVFSLIQALIDPNKLGDKKNGYASILMRSVIAIVLLGITPFIFKEAYQIQNLLIGSTSNSDNVLYKLIIGSADTGTDSFGRTLATELYFSFYRDDDYPYLSNYQNTTDPDSKYYDNRIDEIKDKIRNGKENFGYAQVYLNYAINKNEYVVEFDELLSLVFGVGVLWILVMYCVQVAVRVFQLAYLQIIAPIPILSYISDPEGVFKKWLNQCVSTFLDLFIRLAIIYFVVYFASYIILLFNDDKIILASSTGLNPNDNTAMWYLLKVFLILGLLIFAKKVPDLLKDLFPKLGGAGKFSFGLNPKKELNNTLAAGFIGGAVGAVGAGASNAIHGYMNTKKAFKEKGIGAGFKSIGKSVLSVGGGVVGGAKAGLKTKDISNVGNAVKVANENREKRELKAAAGYHWYRPDKVISDKVMGFAGETTGAEKQIKTAEFRRDALQQSKQIQWENFARTNPRADLSLLRSMQEFEVNGKKVWKGIDHNGNERTFELRGGNYIATDGGVDVRGSHATMVSNSATIDKKIKEQNKTIKGLQTANNDAKNK